MFVRSTAAASLIAAASLVGLAPSAQATTTVNVATWGELSDALSATSNSLIVVTANIASHSNTGSGDAINMGIGSNDVLDLHGHTVTLIANSQNWDGYAAINNYGSTLTIEDTVGGGVLNATGAGQAAGIGGSYYVHSSDGGTTIINSGTVNAKGGSNSGGGLGSAGLGGDTGTITINGGTVNATGGGVPGSSGAGAGIGSSDGTVTITGGTVIARGGSDGVNPGNGGAGIGGSEDFNGASVHISGGSVTAIGGDHGAGIGGGSNCDISGSLTVTGGSVSATGGADATAIGGSGIVGAGCPGADVTIGAGGTVSATPGAGSANTIGGPTADVFGSLTNAGLLTIHGVEVIPAKISVTNGSTGVIDFAGGLSGGGTVVNHGSLFGPHPGSAVATDSTLVTEHNYVVTYNAGDSGATPPGSQIVYALNFSNGHVPLAAPPAGYYWSTQPDQVVVPKIAARMAARSNSGVKVTNKTSLTANYGQSATGATAVTLYAAKIPTAVKPKPPVGPQVNTGGSATVPGSGHTDGIALALLGFAALGAGLILRRRVN